MATEYYLIINEVQKGPFAYEQLSAQGLTADMLVWRAGLPDWTRASELPELFELINITDPYTAGNRGFRQESTENPEYKRNQYGPNRYGPNQGYGQAPQSSAGTDFSRNPQYGPQNNFGQNPQYGPQSDYGRNAGYNQNAGYGQDRQYGPQNNFGQNPQYGPQNNFGRNDYNNGPMPVRQNWQTWALIATIAGFFFSCIGGIFGAVGLYQANKANNLYRAGYDQQGDQANNNAKIMTIIGLVLSAVGILGSAYIFKNGGMLSFWG